MHMSNNETGIKIIAALQVSVDGFIEGPNGEMDWVMMEDEETWRDLFEMLTHVDTFILGRVMYPSYEQYWLAVSITSYRMTTMAIVVRAG
jgi:dihydrofolate reductase